MVDGLNYVFDQAKFEEYLSSSSSKSSSPRKHRRISSPRREVRSIVVQNKSRPSTMEVSPLTPANSKAGIFVQDDFVQKESSHKVSTTLTKRARQRQRQKMARQLAKAMESMDGVHYCMNSHKQSCQEAAASQPLSFSTPIKEEWTLVKRTHPTKKERAQKRRARIIRAHAVIRKAQELNSAKKSTRNFRTWIPKPTEDPRQKLAERSACSHDSHDCLSQSNACDSHNCRGQSNVHDSHDCHG